MGIFELTQLQRVKGGDNETYLLGTMFMLNRCFAESPIFDFWGRAFWTSAIHGRKQVQPNNRMWNITPPGLCGGVGVTGFPTTTPRKNI